MDLQNENKTCNSLGYINHETELEYLTQITQGVHFTFHQLMHIDSLQNGESVIEEYKQNSKQVQVLAPLSSAALFQKDGTITFSGDGSLLVQEKLRKPASSPAPQNKKIRFSGKVEVQLQVINPLQKIMFARACNFRLFLESEEISSLLNEPQKMQQLTTHNVSSDLLLSELLFSNKHVPLLQTEPLTEYTLKKVSFASLCEFRSKMGFKYL